MSASWLSLVVSATRTAWLAAPLLVLMPVTLHVQAGEGAPGPKTVSLSGISSHLTPASTIGDLLANPAFAGFASRLLPWDDRAYDPGMRLDAIDSLLPYHTQIDPTATVASLNRMIDDAGQGQTIAYDIYDPAEVRRDPSKAKTALFFFRGRPGAPFAIIAPGGGFAYVGSLHEGFPYAAEISRAGYNAFVLKYRSGRGGQIPNQDLAAAISFVFRHAAELGVGVSGYSLWGSSAGARMAASIGSHGVAACGGDDVPKPSVVVMAYTAHAEVGSAEPRTFALVGERDRIAPPEVMQRRVTNLRGRGTDVDFRVYPGLGHGFGLGTGTSAQGWIDDALRFWGGR